MNDFPVHTKEIIGYTFLKKIKSHKIEELFKVGDDLILSAAVTYLSSHKHKYAMSHYCRVEPNKTIDMKTFFSNKTIDMKTFCLDLGLVANLTKRCT